MRARTMLVACAVLLGSATAVAPAAATASAAVAATARPPDSLRVAGQSNDPLVATSTPTLSWAPRDTGRNEVQRAYALRVDELITDHGAARTVWSSGKVASSASAGVAYRGPRLRPGHTYEWRVRTWNREQQRSSWSAAQRFDVGLLSVGDWQASWLSAADGALVRRDFTLGQDVVRARLYLGAQGLAEPHLNGAKIAPREVLDSSVTDYAQRVLYREFDVTDQLHRGANALAVMVGKGQYAGTPTFVAQLDVTLADGRQQVISTDDAWRTAAGPTTRDDFYYGQSWDQRRLPGGWDAAAFDDAGWAPVPVVAPVGGPENLAHGRPVTALDETACCGWSRAALVDGVDVSTDASEGYHSAGESDPEHTKWVQVDLGRAQPIAAITLFPAHPTNDPAGDFPGAGFPVRYKIEVGDDPSFATATTVVDHTGTDQPNPGLDPVTASVDATARYVRVTATRLGCHDTSCTFRLAELGVHAPHPATVFGRTALEADPSPPTRIVDTVAPVHTSTPAGGGTVVDFGQNRVGQVELTADAPAGTKVTVVKGELLDANGRVTTSNISFSPTDVGRQTDDYTFDGSGEQTYAPNFNYAGFRYAEVTGLPAGTDMHVVQQVTHTDVASTGSFTTSDPMLNDIQGALRQTQLNNLQTMPLDCPTREKHGWLGDAGDTDAEALANFDMQSLYGKWLGDIRTSANPDGSVPSVAPTQGGTGWFTDPAWGTAFPQVVWDTYQQYGDRTVLHENYAAVRKWVDYLATISDDDHIVTASPGSWGDDWLSTVGTPHVYFQTLFSLIDTRLMAQMARALGNGDDARTYSALAGEIADGFTARYFDPAADSYAPKTQLAYAMPLALGIVPAGHTAGVLNHLVADIAAHGNHLTTGFVGTTYVYQALARFDRNDVALALSQRSDYPSFGYMLAQGPGTIWEKWVDSSQPDGTSSKDHIGLAGSIGQWYYQQLAGIRPGSPGWRTFTLAPSVVGDLTHVEATQQTVRGTVTSSWRLSGDTLTYHALVPVGASASIELPLPGGAGSTVREDGRTIYTAGRRGERDTGLAVGSIKGGTLRLQAGSGDYTFTVTPPNTARTTLAITAAGVASPITAATGGDVTALVETSSLDDAPVQVSAEVPAGWTATATPATVPATAARTAHLVTVHLRPAAGASGGSSTITLTARAADGTIARAQTPVLVFGAWPAGTTASASSTHAPNVVNGQTRTYDPANALDGDLATFWNDDTDSAYPDALTITAPAATILRGVGLASNPDGVPAAFTVQTWDGAQWVTRAEVTDNSDLYRWVPFDTAVTTTQVRVVVTAAQAGFSRVAELAT